MQVIIQYNSCKLLFLFLRSQFMHIVWGYPMNVSIDYRQPSFKHSLLLVLKPSKHFCTSCHIFRTSEYFYNTVLYQIQASFQSLDFAKRFTENNLIRFRKTTKTHIYQHPHNSNEKSVKCNLGLAFHAPLELAQASIMVLLIHGSNFNHFRYFTKEHG